MVNATTCGAGWVNASSPINGGTACYLYVNKTMTWPNATSYCASLTPGSDLTSISLNESSTVGRLLYFLPDSASSPSSSTFERDLVSQLFPAVGEIWTLALGSGPVCEPYGVSRDYWVDGTTFYFMGTNTTNWIGRSTFCPLWVYNAQNTKYHYDWSYDKVLANYGSEDCLRAIGSGVVCRGMFIV